MSRNQLKNYAPKARRDFIRAVSDRAKKVGITGDDQFEPMNEQGDVVVIGGQPFPRKIATQRRSLEKLIKLHGFQQSMEEIAYTWFNRFAAIRFMELHGYLDHGYRVLSHPDGMSDPEILEHAQHVDLPGLSKDTVVELKLDGTKDEQLYRMLLVAQCNALHTSMPFMFERIDDETELLLPDNLLHSDSVIRTLVSGIDEADWQKIEVIGWLYQFYISEKKDQVIGKVVKSEDIPAATQLFTPNWIVKYMVQNSLGYQWMATYPNSPLKGEMDYYIEPAEQTEEVQKQLAEITPKELNPEELTLLDPAAGSGHILVEAYDLFKQIYLERGYRLKDIPRLILEKNLYGLDIDDRAAQMAGFALLMKARADDQRILSSPVHLNVMAIQSSEGLDAADIAKHLLPSGRYELVASDDLLPDTLAQPTLAANASSEVKAGTIESLISLFEDAKTFGSLITVPDNIRQALPALEQLLDQPSSGDLLQRQMREHSVELVRSLVEQAFVLGRKYDCVVANPPYMGGKGMPSRLKGFLKTSFPEYRGDLFAAFISRSINLVRDHGFASLITMESWLFLSSFESARKKILSSTHVKSGIHYVYEGKKPTAMGINFGVVACVFQHPSLPNFSASYYKLRHADLNEDGSPKALSRHSPNFFNQKAISFTTIQGSPIAYWISEAFRKTFTKGTNVGEIASPKQGLATADNDRFLRLWSEVDFNGIGFSFANAAEAEASNLKWFPYNKGGVWRKWYGNQEYIVNWKNDGKEIRTFTDSNGKVRSRPQNTSYYFKEGITWSDITNGGFAARYTPKGFLFDIKGSSAFPDKKYVFAVLSLLSSKLVTSYMDAINPTITFQVGDVSRIPFALSDEEVIATNYATPQRIKIAENDWNSFETSWGFQALPTLSDALKKTTIEASIAEWQVFCDTNILAMKELEEKNNRLFIEAYGLQDELTPDVPEDQITLARADREDDIKRLISYAFGCMMGRYSLAEEGLIYANSGNEGFDPSRYGNFPADDDGIIPITDTEWFDDDVTVRFEEFLKIAWSPETLKENLKFIGDSLANNGGNDPLKTIRNYLSKGFYKDHLQTYKKRPIYWLFSSGKLKAFECLVYLHRYNDGTLARMRVDYVTPLQNKITARIEQLDGDIISAPSTAARKKLEKEQDKLRKQKAELSEFDDKLRHYADQRINLDLDDGVKVNYGKFGDLLAEVKAVIGDK
ncbi:BREX-1 system adenine-specific DNA-methyltransferase PglX [Magnetovibrio blakemorei]|uniref:site-specific DNA-methyltransferase (adenine-specific) n=1 Tax=Magnetovibrio blakemorei TaxID=28181 RepID=A0A1E5Q416_9PROT|nr:BREX-1 system adenine-specific DNA-methyltransferase PglX [Magnetovibrio blakemorei]OEJ64562.1 type II restriction endonuclease [Magnetovibrio blakemorei]